MTGLSQGELALMVSLLALLVGCLFRLKPATQIWSKWFLWSGLGLLVLAVVLLYAEASRPSP